jgi:hypothetical protein
MTSTAVQTRLGLSPARRRLLDLIREIGFGRIEGLIVRSAEPVFAPAPRVLREVSFREYPHVKALPRHEDFALKRQMIGLLEELDRIGDGRIDQMEVQNGLPFRIRVETSPGTAGELNA